MVHHTVWYLSSRSASPGASTNSRAKAADDVVQDLQNALLQNPLRGTVVRGLGGIRKARHSNPSRGKGKRGGFRCLYLYLEKKSHIHLLLLLAKNEQVDLTSAERAILRRLVAEIKETG